MSESELIAMLRDACAQAGGQKTWAVKHGVSPAYLSDVINGLRAPAAKILAAIGVRRVVTYKPVKTKGRRT